MNREIGKYRGQRKDNREWVYGNYVFVNDIHYITNKHVWWEVIPETVGESTGLKDCKRTEEYPEGQEIHEGDTVKMGELESGEITTVAWEEDRFVYTGKVFNLHCYTVEVIGSIHEEKP